MQRLRHRQRIHVPGPAADGGDFQAARVNQHWRPQVRGDVRIAFHKHAVVVLAGKARAGEGDKVRLHAGRGLAGNRQHVVDRGALGQGRRIAIRRDHGRQTIRAPGADQPRQELNILRLFVR